MHIEHLLKGRFRMMVLQHAIVKRTVHMKSGQLLFLSCISYTGYRGSTTFLNRFTFIMHKYKRTENIVHTFKSKMPYISQTLIRQSKLKSARYIYIYIYTHTHTHRRCMRCGTPKHIQFYQKITFSLEIGKLVKCVEGGERFS
jgi:hypothetical protein